MTARPHASAENFELLEELGKGGFATTYRARVVDPELCEEFGTDEVALKIPLDRQKGRVLRRELELNAGIHMRLKGLHATNLVRYLGFELFRDQIVMVMEYIPQGSLRGVMGPIGRQRPVQIEEAVRIAEEVLQGLMVIHREHVLHRDIKPENILMHGRTPKIADFGIARIVDDHAAMTVAGTVAYMAPEVLTGRGSTFPADLWSLSVTLYEMVTGRIPFGDLGTPLKPLIELICTREPQPVQALRPDAPAPLADLIARGLEKQPERRFSSAEEMQVALASLRARVSSPIAGEIDMIRELMRQVGTTDLAARRCRDLLARYPDDWRAHQCAGELHARRHHYAEAIAAFTRAVGLNPQDAVLHWNLALAYQGAGRARDAIASLERAMALDLDSSLRRHAGILQRVLRTAAGA